MKAIEQAGFNSSMVRLGAELQDDTMRQLEVGSIYGQTITGTTFKQRVLKCQGNFNSHNYYLVENIETGFRCTMPGSDLHDL